MSLTRIAWRYLWARPVVTSLTLLGVILGAGLISGVLHLRRAVETAFVRESATFDLVVGAKGSPLQLVLSSIYWIDDATGTIDYDEVESLASRREVSSAVPIAVGDGYRGFRIVGTERSFFDLKRRDDEGRLTSPLATLDSGELFDSSFEAVLGAEVARATQLKIGESFVSAHGVSDVSIPGQDHDESPFRVVGLLNPQGSPVDRAIFVSLDSVWEIHEHHEEEESEHPGEDEEHEEEEHEHRKVSSVLVQLKIPSANARVADEIGQSPDLLAAIPMQEMFRLKLQLLDPLETALLALGAIVVVVAILSVATTIAQSAERRRRELAIARSLGASRSEILALVGLEAGILSFLGVAIGYVVGHASLAVAQNSGARRLGVTFDAWQWNPLEAWALLAVFVAACIAGSVPAFIAYRRSPVMDLELQ
ncbi:MAG: ABC transporter permease [Planctomycetota bacterium]